MKKLRRQFLVSVLAVFAAGILFAPVKSLAAPARKNIIKSVTYDYESTRHVYIYVTPAAKGTRPQYEFSPKMLSGNRWYIDFHNSKIQKKLNASISNSVVKTLKRNQFDPTTTRVVIEFRSNDVKPKVSYDAANSRFVVSFSGGKTPSGKTSTYTGKKYRIMLDPGHGGWEPGAKSRDGKTYEKTVTLEIAKKLEQKLKGRDDVIVELTRRTDEYIHPYDRRTMARDWDADLFISIHANGNTNTHINQTEIYYYDRKSLPLAKAIQKELKQELQLRDGGVRKYPYAVIRNSGNIGSVLVESAYISNKTGLSKLTSSSGQNKIAKGIYESIETILNSRE
ncbi:N-acetylmuramoyl-L-alanine amidase [candidate division KSB1 bacterium]